MSAPRLDRPAAVQSGRAQRRRQLIELPADRRLPLRVLGDMTGWSAQGALRDDARGLVAEGLATMRRGRCGGGFSATEAGRKWLAGAR